MRKLKKSAVALALLFIYIFSLTPLSVSAEYIETAGKAQDVQISSRIYELIFGKETKRSDGELRLIPGGDTYPIVDFLYLSRQGNCLGVTFLWF